MRRIKILLIAFAIALPLIKCDVAGNDTDRLYKLFGAPTSKPADGAKSNTTVKLDWNLLNDETKRLLGKLFGDADNPANSTTELPVNRFENKTEGEVTETYNVKSDCTAQNMPGICVPYYLCDPATKTVIDDGSGVIDIRSTDSGCPHYLDVCCQSHNVTNKPVKPAPPAACGWSNPGGHGLRFRDEDDNLTSAYYAEYPWVVALIRKTEESQVWSTSDYLGVGSIIHPSVVLTAAHKVDGKKPNELKCRAGEWDTQTDYEEDPFQERDVKKIVIHKNFFRPSVINSIALVFMERPFDLANNVAVACISPQPPLPQTYCQTTGWGKEFSSKEKYAVLLKKIVLPTVERDKCQRALRNTRLGSRFELHESLTCAGGQKGQDVCTGDGGAPLMCPIVNEKDKTRFAIYGLVAYGIGCGKEGVPGVYVNVPILYSWIQETMATEGYGTDTFTN